MQMVYSNLVRAKPGYLGPLEPGEYLPDFAESWEVSPDKTVYTFKLRPDVIWHNKAPVNGRGVDREDILFSWERFVNQGRRRRDFANELNPDAPIVSWTMPDDESLVLQLKKPTVNLLDLFTPGHAGLPSIIPKETDSGFDIRYDMIGTGPWVAHYTPSVGFKFDRHPEYYGEEQPFADHIDAPFLFEYAQQRSQLIAGNLYTVLLRQEDVVATKGQVPELKLLASQPPNTNTGSSLVFGWLPVEENKPFKDDRVRQALSMALDRDLFLDALYNGSAFEQEGLPVETYWYSVMGPGAGAFSLDPPRS